MPFPSPAIPCAPPAIPPPLPPRASWGSSASAGRELRAAVVDRHPRQLVTDPQVHLRLERRRVIQGGERHVDLGGAGLVTIGQRGAAHATESARDTRRWA